MATMNKQTKQAIILGGLLVVLGGFALYTFVFKGDAPKPAAATNAAVTHPPTTPPPAPGQPAAAPGQPAVAGQPAAVAAGPEVPLPIPAEPDKDPDGKFRYGDQGFTWEISGDATAIAAAYDPLHVQNLEVVEPGRRKYIENFRAAWVIEGVTEFSQYMKVLDEDKNPKKDAEGKDMMEWRLVREVWFKGKTRPYREDDRLTLTRFTIKKIIRNLIEPGPIETAVEIEGDNGEKLKLVLAKPDRYGVIR
jgi:hypothetical protein